MGCRLCIGNNNLKFESSLHHRIVYLGSRSSHPLPKWKIVNFLFLEQVGGSVSRHYGTVYPKIYFPTEDIIFLGCIRRAIRKRNMINRKANSLRGNVTWTDTDYSETQ